MPKCPECKKEIEHLNNYQSGESRYRLWNDGKYDLYDFSEFIGDGNVNDYECQICQKILFTNEEEAISFLRGG